MGKIQVAKLSTTVFGRNKIVVTFWQLIIRFTKCVGGEIYVALPVYNEIHGSIAIYQT